MTKNSVTIDAVIPAYHPDERLFQILTMLSSQTLLPRKVHLINTEKEGLDRLLEQQGWTEEQLRQEYPFLTVEHIRPEEFDHGGTRNRGFRECGGADFVLAMTQDALPKDEFLIRNLLQPMEEPEGKRIAVTFARQLPNRDASCEERISRAFNYPEEPVVKSEEDRKQLGVKTYFCSNVCALYRMTVWHELGGFPDRAIFNEDMVYAGKALKAGWQIRYTPEACVYHSHSYSASQQFHRNFDLGVSQAQNPQIFAETSSEGEGVSYVKTVCGRMKKEQQTGEIPGFIGRCAARYLGYRLGKAYRHLPHRMVVRFSSNKNYWKHDGK